MLLYCDAESFSDRVRYFKVKMNVVEWQDESEDECTSFVIMKETLKGLLITNIKTREIILPKTTHRKRGS